MRTIARTTVCCLFLSMSLFPQDLCAQDLVIEGVTVHTSSGKPWTSGGGPGGIVVVDGRIQKPGTKAPASALRVKLAGAHLYPGLHDAHGHLSGLGSTMDQVDLKGARTFEEIVARVQRRAKKTPKGEWILGRGWDQI